jgi:regulation of enolase protein 1 (concanavalin A-like superfamily)
VHVADAFMVTGFPGELRPSDVGAWSIGPDGALVGSAGPETDLFIDPAGGAPVLSAPSLLGAAPADDFQFRARVSVEFAATYDAGVLLLWTDDRTWAKLCFEFSPQRQPMIVSVVTRGVSDDANAFPVDTPSVWLRIARSGPAWAFHASVDGTRWQLIRHFRLGSAAPEIGFEVQSPTGEGCTASFEQIAVRTDPLTDLRDGT